jgi:hypothetical protein
MSFTDMNKQKENPFKPRRSISINVNKSYNGEFYPPPKHLVDNKTNKVREIFEADEYDKFKSILKEIENIKVK